ncbi:MAG: hypothetical protein ACYDAY_11185 [Candidatus Dormibacteria bacterium]
MSEHPPGHHHVPEEHVFTGDPRIPAAAAPHTAGPRTPWPAHPFAPAYGGVPIPEPTYRQPFPGWAVLLGCALGVLLVLGLCALSVVATLMLAGFLNNASSGY